MSQQEEEYKIACKRSELLECEHQEGVSRLKGSSPPNKIMVLTLVVDSLHSG